MNYNIEDVKRALNDNNLKFEFDNENNKNKNTKIKRGRGRPRKLEIENEEDGEIVVRKVIIKGEVYLRTEEGVILDKNSYDVVDIVE